jgi:hypothetical protein
MSFGKTQVINPIMKNKTRSTPVLRLDAVVAPHGKRVLLWMRRSDGAKYIRLKP